MHQIRVSCEGAGVDERARTMKKYEKETVFPGMSTLANNRPWKQVKKAGA